MYNMSMNFLKRHLIVIFLATFLITVPVVTSAQVVGGAPADACPPGQICNPLASRGINDIPGFIKALLEGVLKIGIPIIALAIIYCGFLFVAARGNSEKLTKAKDALLYTLIGAAILLGSWAIAQMISATVTGLKAGV